VEALGNCPVCPPINRALCWQIKLIIRFNRYRSMYRRYCQYRPSLRPQRALINSALFYVTEDRDLCESCHCNKRVVSFVLCIFYV